jgi:1-deoxy-D-xylulose-5-phosphate synthase
VVMAAGDEAELMHMTATAAAHDTGPIAFRFPRGEGIGVALPERGEILEIGKGRVMREGKDVAILNFGARLAECMKAANILAEHGLDITVADARFAKPLDETLIEKLIRDHAYVVTIEEGASSGFGAQVLTLAANRGWLDRGSCKLRTLTLPDYFQAQDKPEKMYDEAGLNAAQLVATISTLLGKKVPIAAAA